MEITEAFLDICTKVWEKTHSSKRIKFLEEMITELGGKPAWLNGTSIHRLASLHHFFLLPLKLREQLTMAVTENEFSMSEFKMVRAGLGLTRRERR
jgi:hypothetical protein